MLCVPRSIFEERTTPRARLRCDVAPAGPDRGTYTAQMHHRELAPSRSVSSSSARVSGETLAPGADCSRGSGAPDAVGRMLCGARTWRASCRPSDHSEPPKTVVRTALPPTPSSARHVMSSAAPSFAYLPYWPKKIAPLPVLRAHREGKRRSSLLVGACKVPAGHELPSGRPYVKSLGIQHNI